MLNLEKALKENFTKMSYEKEFSMIDAFLALKDLDDDSVAEMVKPDTKPMSEGKVESRRIAEGKEFSILGGGDTLEAAKDFLNENDDVQLEVIDVDADSLDHVKDRIEYVGQIILSCNRCHANKFIDMDKLVEDPEDAETYNLEDECPNCKTSGTGYSMIGQVGKFEEEKPEVDTSDEADAATADDETVAVENDESDPDAIKFENDLEPESSDTEETAETDADAVEEVSDEDEPEEKDLMDTTSSEDDDEIDLTTLGDEVDVDDELKVDDEDEEDVKESLNEGVQLNKNAEDAWMMNRVIQAMNNEDAYYGSWLYIWPDGETREMCAYDFSDDEDYDELRDAFEKTYRRYHADGLFEADTDVLEYAHRTDELLGLAKIDNLRAYHEELEMLKNATITEVLGSVLDTDKIQKVVVSNKADDKETELFNGEYKDLPSRLAAAECTGFDVADHQLACNVDQDEVHGRRCVGDILSKFCDDTTDNICLVDVASSDEIFRGNKADAIEKFGKCGFISIDTPAVIRLTICDPTLVADAADDTAKDPAEALVEHIFAANNLSKYRASKPTSKEFWISESIMQKDDLELIYETFVKPSSDAALISEFKSITGYRNELEEAYEAGYKAAEAVNEATAVATAPNVDEDEDLEDMEIDTLSVTWKVDGRPVDQDYITFSYFDGSWSAKGNVIEIKPEHETLAACVLAVIEEAESLGAAYPNAEIEFNIEDELEQYLSDGDKEVITSTTGYIVEELSEDVDQKYIIVAITKDGERKYYNADSSEFVDTTAEATIYGDHDDALTDWFDIDKKQYKRVFVPNYDPAYFDECVEEKLIHKAAASVDEGKSSVEHGTCENCGGTLNDMGTCPKCDDGEEELDEAKMLSEDYESLRQIVDEEFPFAYQELGKASIDAYINYFKDLMYESDVLDDSEFSDEEEEALRSILTDYLEDIDDYGDIDECKLTEAAKSVLDIPSAVAQSIKVVTGDYGMNVGDEEFPVMVFDYICDNLDAGMPSEKDAYIRWSNDIYDEINKQTEEIIAAISEPATVAESTCRSFKTRKELAAAIAECKNNSRPYTVKRSVKEGYRYDLYEGDDAVETNAVVPAQSNYVMSEIDHAITEKIMRISRDISHAIQDIYGIDVQEDLIVADIMQDLQLIGGRIDVRDLPDTPANRLTAQMYQSHEDFYAFMDAFVTALTGRPLNATPEKKLAYAVKMLDGPNFSTEAIRAGIEAPQFQRLVATGGVPFIPADVRPQLTEDLDVEVDTTKFDADMNSYFNEAYDEAVLYTTTSGEVEADGTIILEGLIQSDDIDSAITFTLKPEISLNESLITESDKAAILANAEYTVTNNLSEEVFTFNFSE